MYVSHLLMNTSYFHLSDTVNNAAILTYKNLFQSLLLSFLLSTHACMLSLQSCLTLSDPMDCSLPGCSVHGILQARILEWAAMSSSRGSFPPRDQTQVSRHCCRWTVHHGAAREAQEHWSGQSIPSPGGPS